MPLRNGSVFDAFKRIFNKVGLVILSTLTSSKVRCAAGSKAESDGTVTPPEHKKPKKARVTAAQSMMWSWDGPRASHTSPTRLIMGGVMGDECVWRWASLFG